MQKIVRYDCCGIFSPIWSSALSLYCPTCFRKCYHCFFQLQRLLLVHKSFGYVVSVMKFLAFNKPIQTNKSFPYKASLKFQIKVVMISSRALIHLVRSLTVLSSCQILLQRKKQTWFFVTGHSKISISSCNAPFACSSLSGKYLDWPYFVQTWILSFLQYSLWLQSFYDCS